jgi:hypothetical protein
MIELTRCMDGVRWQVRAGCAVCAVVTWGPEGLSILSGRLFPHEREQVVREFERRSKYVEARTR